MYGPELGFAHFTMYKDYSANDTMITCEDLNQMLEGCAKRNYLFGELYRDNDTLIQSFILSKCVQVIDTLAAFEAINNRVFTHVLAMYYHYG